MISKLPARFANIVAATVWMLFAGGLQAPVGAQELSGKELRRAAKQADSAFGAGRFDQAIELYDRILDSTSGTDARRGDALYAGALIRLSAGGGHQDLAAAKRYLEELMAFPRHPRRQEIATLRSLLAGQDAARAEVQGRVAELDAKLDAFEAERERAAAERAEAAGESKEVGGRVRSLESQLRKVRAELAECRAELEAKEQALQKLRDALVGGSS